MRTSTSACLGVILVWASAASAQTWQDAYNRGDYAAAASLLQAAVFEHPADGPSRYPDVQDIQALARLYAEGRGVPQDELTACALSNLGSGAAVYRHGDRDPRTVAIRRQVEAYCVPLTPSERREAMQYDGCLQQGPSPRILSVSPARKVELGRSRLAVTDRGRTREYPIAPLVRCAQQVADVRHVRVPAPKGSGLAPREFIQIFSWHSAVVEGRRERTLEWSAVELTAQGAAVRARTVLEQEDGSAWPARPVPEAFTRGASFAMHRSGDVRWQMAARRSLHGIIGRPGALRASTRTR